MYACAVYIRTVNVPAESGNSPGISAKTEVSNMAEPAPSVSLSRMQNMMNTPPAGMASTKLYGLQHTGYNMNRTSSQRMITAR